MMAADNAGSVYGFKRTTVISPRSLELKRCDLRWHTHTPTYFLEAMANIYEFSAGRVDLDNKTGQATPIRGQGKVVLKQSSEDPSLLAIQWQPRGGYHHIKPSEELVVLPGDVEFEHVPEGKLGRVLMMRLLSSGMRVLYWLQDAPEGDLDHLSEKDEEIILKLNELANQEIEEPEEEAEPEQELHDAHEQVEELTKTEEQGHTHLEANRPQSDDEMQVDAERPGAEPSSTSQGLGPTRTRLSQAVPVGDRAAHVATASDAELEALLKHAPEVAKTRSELVEVVHSPHFSRALDELGQAVLESPALAQSLGLSRQPVSVEDFLNLLKNLYKK